MTSKRFTLILTLIALIFTPLLNADSEKKPLRVGISPTDPPFQYWQQNKIIGLEADFATELGKELGREIVFVDLPFNKLIPSLLAEEIDIIMSAMSVTTIRNMQIAFTTPYIKIGQMALVRLEDRKLYPSPISIALTKNTVGAKEFTTGQFLVVSEFPNAQKRFYSTPAKGATALLKKKIDLLILDSPFVWWLAMKNEGKLTPVPFFLTEENIAWGLRKTDAALLETINKLVAKWKTSGTIEEIIRRHIPEQKS